MNDLSRIAAILLSFFVGSAAHAQTPENNRLHILERGIYEAQTDWTREPASRLWRVYNVRLRKATSNIPMRRHLRFGFRYILQGAPHGGSVAVDLVTRYPAPGLLDPKTQLWRTESRYRVDLIIGVPRYREFQFVEDEEFVPGIWVFEFWQGDRKLGEQLFCVWADDGIGRPAEFEVKACEAATS